MEPGSSRLRERAERQGGGAVFLYGRGGRMHGVRVHPLYGRVRGGGTAARGGGRGRLCRCACRAGAGDGLPCGRRIPRACIAHLQRRRGVRGGRGRVRPCGNGARRGAGALACGKQRAAALFGGRRALFGVGGSFFLFGAVGGVRAAAGRVRGDQRPVRGAAARGRRGGYAVRRRFGGGRVAVHPLRVCGRVGRARQQGGAASSR